MHPALSVIFFTTLSGAGYGLAALLSLGLLPAELISTKFGFAAALGLISIGLMSSTLHLGNPQRAWRAFSQWRSSWLSREGVMAIITYIPLTLQAYLVIFFDRYLIELSWLIVFLCIVTVYCTAMIYASLRTVASWHTALTPLTYLLFSLASGASLFLVFAGFAGQSTDNLILLVIAALLLAWLAKWFWARRNDKIGTGSSTLASATGLGHLGKVRLLESPHATENYLTHEMGYRIGRKHEKILWNIAVIVGLLLPIIALSFATSVQSRNLSVWLEVLAAGSLMMGLFVERWLFFANAKHAVSLYYDHVGDPQ